MASSIVHSNALLTTLPARHHYRRRRSCRLRVCNAVVGIDLGTSNSAVAVVTNGKPHVLRDTNDSNYVPSIVAITEYDQTVVGHEACQGVASVDNTFYSFKRLIGRKLCDVLQYADKLLYRVGEGDRGEALAYSSNLDDMVSPEELSSWVLLHLIKLAERHLQERVTGAVVTVPAHFNDRQLGATRQAACLAGLPESQIQLLQEPVAAALAYGIGGGTDGDTVLVFDLGGGTYDVSILQAFEGILEVLGTAGDSNLGGNDFDAVLADWIMRQTGIDDRQWAIQAGEQAKIELSQKEEASIQVPSNSSSSSITLDQQTFEATTAGLFERMAGPLEHLGKELFVEWAVQPRDAVPGKQEPGQAALTTLPAGSNHGSSSSDIRTTLQGQEQQLQQQQGKEQQKWVAPARRITRVVLVGQSSRLPAVQRFVERMTGIRPLMSVDPAEAVALGAAVQAGVLLGQLGSVELMDGAYSVHLHDRATGFGSSRTGLGQ